MRCLISGAPGFVGSHLCEFALKEGAEVWGIRRFGSSMDNVKDIRMDIKWIEGDLTDRDFVKNAFTLAKPDWVFGLAAQSDVKKSFDNPFETFDINVKAHLNILEAMRVGMFGKFLSVGSSDEYGYVQNKELPIMEEQELRPISPYGVSKSTQNLLSYQYNKSYHLDIIRARPFNHEGPRKRPVFSVSGFAKQFAEIEAGKVEPVIYHGNLDAIRDFTDVRDVVRAYWLLMQRGRSGEVYNIASGQGWKLHAVLDLIEKNSSVQNVEFKQDLARMRPSDIPRMIGCYDKIRDELDWEPEIGFEETIQDTLDFWREKARI